MNPISEEKENRSVGQRVESMAIYLGRRTLQQERDLLRSRQQLMQQQGALRKHIQSLLRRNSFHYKAKTQRKTHWRKHHYGWLERTVEGCSGSLKTNLSLLLRQLKGLHEILVASDPTVPCVFVDVMQADHYMPTRSACTADHPHFCLFTFSDLLDGGRERMS